MINYQCPKQEKKSRVEGYGEFISIEFIQNLASVENLRSYGDWQALEINDTWVRTDSFQWRLVDL